MIADTALVDWVFRYAGDCLIEFPDLRIPPPPPRCQPRAWVATLWRDPTLPGTWASRCWEAADRGWHIPSHLVVGDVLQFGLAAINPCDGLPAPGCDQRWYGWLHTITELALVIAGPYADADSCAAAAANTVAELRLAQLTGPDIDPAWVPDDVDTGP